MVQKIKTISLAVLSLLMFVSCSSEPKISEQNVSRVIQTLSSDAMKGRHALSEEIEYAADFISSEFQSIGLSELPGLNSYRQTFNIYSIAPEQARVVVNDTELQQDHYFALLHNEESNWNSDTASPLYISSDDNYRNRFNELTSDDQSSVIFVDDAHKKLFHRYRTYFSRPTRTSGIGQKPDDLFILQAQEVRSFNIQFQNTVTSHELYNVAGMIEGERTDEIVLFSAHYDHRGVINPVDGDSIANGANDNASGVAAVIELARYFSHMPKPERTLYFVGFTAEEAGGYGSRYFSQQLNPDEIVAMFNIEMIGKPAVEGPNTAWITGYNRSTFGDILQNSVADSNFVFYPDPYPNQNLFYRSDNATLARLGVPAHTISTTPIDVDQDYHQVTDEFNTLHIPHTTNTIKAISKAAKVIISGEETPTRIDVDTLD